jgi:hypothetical protein
MIKKMGMSRYLKEEKTSRCGNEKNLEMALIKLLLTFQK